jgi:hypothetical protein
MIFDSLPEWGSERQEAKGVVRCPLLAIRRSRSMSFYLKFNRGERKGTAKPRKEF